MSLAYSVVVNPSEPSFRGHLRGGKALAAAEPELSVVCFRHVPTGLQGAALDAHQDRLQAALELSGDGWLTTTRLRGSTWLRAGVLNYLATEADIDHLLETLRTLAATT